MGEEGSLGIDKSDGSISALAHLKNFQPAYCNLLITMYDFPNSTDIFGIFEVRLANSHILVRNHLATPKLAIFEQWRPDWR